MPSASVGCARVAVVPRGQMANQMLQYMAAQTLAWRVGDERPIGGCELGQFGLAHPPAPAATDGGRGVLVLEGHDFSLRASARLMRADPGLRAEIHGWGARLAHFASDRLAWQRLFTPLQPTPHPAFGDDVLLVHVRAGDIAGGAHADYLPLPPRLIDAVAAASGKQVVFIGQLDDGNYVRRLRARFPRADFLPQASPLADFQTLRASTNVLVSTSTFGWLATWLSDTTRAIHLPVLGMFNPAQRPDIDLLPTGDPRYRFYRFPPTRWSGNLDELDALPFKPIGGLRVQWMKRRARAVERARRIARRLS